MPILSAPPDEATGLVVWCHRDLGTLISSVRYRDRVDRKERECTAFGVIGIAPGDTDALWYGPLDPGRWPVNAATVEATLARLDSVGIGRMGGPDDRADPAPGDSPLGPLVHDGARGTSVVRIPHGRVLDRDDLVRLLDALREYERRAGASPLAR